MLKSLKRITYPVADIVQAKEWYCGILDSQPLFDSPFAVVFSVGGCALTLTQSSGESPEIQESAVTYWDVDEIEYTYNALIASGAREHTPISTVMNISSAKLVDPFGNILGITSPDNRTPKDKMVEKKASESAMDVTFCRALAVEDEREEIRGADTMAKHFLTGHYLAPLQNREAREWGKKQLGPFYGYMIARTAYVDKLFCEALENEVPQIVFLGAGYDTRAYRYSESIGNTKIFEVDAVSTQERKVELLGKAGVPVHSAVAYVSANFKTDSLVDVLAEAGYSSEKKTLFIWEGVSCYLPQEAVEKTLEFVQDYAASGSTLFFDYLTEERESFYEAEPFRFWIDSDGVVELLAKYNISPVEMLDPVGIEQRFLTLNNGSFGENTVPYLSFILGARE